MLHKHYIPHKNLINFAQPRVYSPLHPSNQRWFAAELPSVISLGHGTQDILVGYGDLKPLGLGMAGMAPWTPWTHGWRSTPAPASGEVFSYMNLLGKIYSMVFTSACIYVYMSICILDGGEIARTVETSRVSKMDLTFYNNISFFFCF